MNRTDIKASLMGWPTDRFKDLKTFYISGSWIKGTFSKNSDLDVVLVWLRLPDDEERIEIGRLLSKLFATTDWDLHLDPDFTADRCDRFTSRTCAPIEIFHLTLEHLVTFLSTGNPSELKYQEVLFGALNGDYLFDHLGVGKMAARFLPNNAQFDTWVSDKIVYLRQMLDVLLSDRIEMLEKASLQLRWVTEYLNTVLWKNYQLISGPKCLMSRVKRQKIKPSVEKFAYLEDLVKAPTTVIDKSVADSLLEVLASDFKKDISIPEVINFGELQLTRTNNARSNEVFNLIERNRTRLEEQFSWTKHLKSVADQSAFFDSAELAWNSKRAFHFHLLFREKVVGALSVHTVDFSKGTHEFGYWLTSECEGLGLITNALKTVMAELNKIGLDKPTIRTRPSNSRSVAVAQRLAFRKHRLESKSDGDFVHYSK